MRNAESKFRLSPAAVSAMEDELRRIGYSILRGVVSKRHLSELNEQLIEAYRSSPKFEGGGSILGHLNCYPGEAGRFVFEELRDCGLIDAMLAMRVDRRNDMFARVNWNLSGSAAQHWHMDGTFIEDFLLCNIAIIDITKRNGPMEVIPGSHAEFCPFWRFSLERRARLAVPVLLEQGDVLIRTSTLWHRGTPNRSGAVRPMMSLSFGEKEATDVDPFLANGGDISFYPNWYSNSSSVDVLRERVERALPISRSAGRLVKSVLRPHGYDSY
jgi:hypothetical protein